MVQVLTGATLVDYRDAVVDEARAIMRDTGRDARVFDAFDSNADCFDSERMFMAASFIVLTEGDTVLATNVNFYGVTQY